MDSYHRSNDCPQQGPELVDLDHDDRLVIITVPNHLVLQVEQPHLVRHPGHVHRLQKFIGEERHLVDAEDFAEDSIVGPENFVEDSIVGPQNFAEESWL